MDRASDEQGMVTAFVVTLTLALLVVIGLVLDGGYSLAARREAIDEADGAARAAAQSVGLSSRRGPVVLDQGRAQAAADAFLAPTGHAGQATVQGDAVTVTVSFPHRMLILGVGHLLSIRVRGRGIAHAVRGIEKGAGP
jgi:Flp pilus assembly protein TadG